jgi:hypothetical protein
VLRRGHIRNSPLTLTKRHCARTGSTCDWANWIIRRYYHGRRPEYNGVKLYFPTTMTIKRFRYRGMSIPTPWDQPTAFATT